MKISRSRKHHVNLGNYESVEFGASVEVDTAVDPVPLGDGKIFAHLDRILSDLLAADINEALANVPEGDKTHVETWGVEK